MEQAWLTAADFFWSINQLSLLGRFCAYSVLAAIILFIVTPLIVVSVEWIESQQRV